MGAAPSCKIYTAWEVFKYNILWWNLSFLVGLNFTHLDNGPMRHLTLDPADIAKWGKPMWIFAIFLLILVLLILLVISSAYIKLGIFSYYIAYGIALILFMVW